MERIQLQVLDGLWETLGVDRDRGAKPTGVAPSWSAWGSDALSFSLDRSLAIDQPDLQALTPIRWEVDGRVLWSGFTIDTPGAGGDAPSLTVQALGWQHAFDDDAYSAMFVHSDLTEWKDSRSFAADPSQLSRLTVQATVLEGGHPALSWAKGVPIDPDNVIGITLDCGPDPSTWPTDFDLVIESFGSSLTANYLLYVRLHDSMEYLFTAGVTGTDRHDAVAAASSGISWGGSLNGSRRFITVFLLRAPGAPVIAVNSTDIGFRIKKLNLYGNSIYRSGTASNLRVSQIIADALSRVPGIDPLADEITTTSLILPHADWRNEDRTPREVIEQYNAYHRYRPRVSVAPKLSYTPQQLRAAFKATPGKKGARFQDASANSGRDLYNKVIVRGSTGSGKPVRVVRMAVEVIPTADTKAVPLLQPSNPSALTNTTGWSSSPPNFNTVTRDTATFDSSPASIKVTSTSWAPTTDLTQFWPSGQVFKAGHTYILTYAFRLDYTGVPANGNAGCLVTWGAGNYEGYAVSSFLPVANVWTVRTIAWTPNVDVASNLVKFKVQPYSMGSPAVMSAMYADSLEVREAAPTILDRRGRTRTKILTVGSPVDDAAAALLGDAFLQIASKSTLKGALEISTDEAVTEVMSDRPIPASDLGEKTGDLILLANIVDPDTGTMGRVGTIAAVSYSGGVATVAIDNQRDNFEALLARMGVVQS